MIKAIKKWWKEYNLKQDCKAVGICYKHKILLTQQFAYIKQSDWDWCKECWRERYNERSEKELKERYALRDKQREVLKKLHVPEPNP